MNIILSILISTLFLIGSIFLYKKIGLKALYFIIGIITITAVFTMDVYPADEPGHYQNINTLIQEKRLPLINDSQDRSYINILNKNYESETKLPSNYEAFQPPLFYLICIIPVLILKLFTNNPILKFYLLRLISAGFIIASIFFILKTYNLLIEKNILKRNNPLFFIISLLFLCSPGIFWINSTINNSSMAIFLISGLFYYLAKINFLEEIKTKQILILSFLMGLICLTKLEGLYLFGTIPLFLIYKKKYKEIFLFLGIVLLMLLPWFIFNYINYGEIVAVSEHLRAIGNPQYYSGVREYVVQLGIMLKSMWFFSTFTRLNSSILLKTQGYFNILFFSIIALSLINPLKKIKKNLGKISKENFIFILFMLSIILNFIYMSLQYFQNMNGLNGRFFYSLIIPFIILFYKFNNEVVKNKVKYLKWAYFISIIICLISIINF